LSASFGSHHASRPGALANFSSFPATPVHIGKGSLARRTWGSIAAFNVQLADAYAAVTKTAF
jgi:hypothetical protein